MSSITFTTRDLPSKGLFYDRVYNITLHSLSLGQYKELMRSSESFYKVNIIKVLSEIVESDGLDISSMFYGDVMSLLMWYKCNSSIETNLSFTKVCDRCQNKIEFFVNLGEFDLEDIEGYGNGVELPSGRFLEFSPKTFIEYEKSKDVIGHICNVFKYLTPNDIDNMDLDDFLYLKDYVENFNMGFKYKGEISCHFCRNRYKVELDADVDYVMKRVDYNIIMKNIFHISKYANYKFTNDEDLFDYETSIGIVGEMMDKESEDYEKLSKKR